MLKRLASQREAKSQKKQSDICYRLFRSFMEWRNEPLLDGEISDLLSSLNSNGLTLKRIKPKLQNQETHK